MKLRRDLPPSWMARLLCLAPSCIVSLAVIWLQPDLPAHQALHLSGLLAWCLFLLALLLSVAIAVDAIGEAMPARSSWIKVLQRGRFGMLAGLFLCLAGLVFLHSAVFPHMAMALYTVHALMAAGIALFVTYESPKE